MSMSISDKMPLLTVHWTEKMQQMSRWKRQPRDSSGCIWLERIWTQKIRPSRLNTKPTRHNMPTVDRYQFIFGVIILAGLFNTFLLI